MAIFAATTPEKTNRSGDTLVHYQCSPRRDILCRSRPRQFPSHFPLKSELMAKDHSGRFLGIVNQSRQQITECSVQDAANRQTAGDTFHLVDVREESEFAASHVPDAIHLGKGVIERDIEKTIPDLAAPIVLYCGGGYRSALAAVNLQLMGYTNVISMDGGFTGWKNANLPTT